MMAAQVRARPPLRLATRARVKVLAWPYYAESELETLAKTWGWAIASLPDACLCLRHDRHRDVPLDEALRRVRVAFDRALGGAPLEILVVDDDLDEDGWRGLGRAVSAAIAPAPDPERRAAVARLGVKLLPDPGELSSSPPLRLADASDRIALGTPPAAVDFRRKQLFVVYGYPGQGKSTLCSAMAEGTHHRTICFPDQSLETEVTLIRLDGVYVWFVKNFVPDKLPLHWTDSASDGILEHLSTILTREERADFFGKMVETIDAALESSRRAVLVDGWSVELLLPLLSSRFAERANIFPIKADRNVYEMAHGPVWRGSVAARVVETRTGWWARCTARNEAVAAEIREHVRQLYAAKLAAATHYQGFEDLGQSVRDSRSREKLEGLRLPPLGGRSVLDVGCNAGYFSLRARQRGASYVLGIDPSAGDLALARAYRDHVYELDAVDFEQTDIFDLAESRRFDLVLALSVFHYFRDRQPEFLAKARRLLTPGGLLVLEAGITTERPDEPFVLRYARGVDGSNPCHFPNRRALLEMATRAGLTLAYEGPSVSQLGDPIPRTVFHLRAG